MKYILTIFVLSFVAIQCFAQRSSDLKAGIGYPYVFGNEDTPQNLHTITGFPTISIEKPIAFGLPKKKTYSINPGLSYFFFKENEVRGTEVVGIDYKLNHHSVNGYIKWLYQFKFKRKTEAFAYLGAITALHLFTRTKGLRITNGQNPDPDKQHLEIKDNKSGTDFFDLFYYGAVVGYQPNAKITKMIKPSFEVKFYPGLVMRTHEKQSAVEFTILIGYRQ
ncbi:MAG: hypothetical protein HQ522_23350 [Bacteroidetes bacterium]|nr:hypothetical protein [Bacteroidota bacterium]